MKTINKIILTTFTLVLLISLVPAKAQHPAVQDFYKQHKGNDDVHHIVLDGGIFKLLTWITSWDESDEEAQALGRITKDLKGIEVIVVPKHLEGSYTFNDVQRHVKKDKFEELMNIREDNSLVSVYARGKEKEVRDMIIFIDEDDEYSIISLKGVLNMDDLKYLADHHKDLK